MSELYELFSQHPRISTDTRRIEPDSIFFALRGDTFDGNRFVAEALEKGAAYAVSDDPQVAASDERQRIVLVDDTLKALQAEVGGYIETVTIASDVVVICNEEGVPLGMPYNCRFVDVDFVGPILVVGRNKDEFCDVPEADFLMHHLRGEEDTHDD